MRPVGVRVPSSPAVCHCALSAPSAVPSFSERERERCSAEFLHGCLLNKISQSISGIFHSSCCCRCRCCNMRFIFLRLPSCTSPWSWSSSWCCPALPLAICHQQSSVFPFRAQDQTRRPHHSAQPCFNRWLHVCKDNLIIAKCSIV